MKSEKLKFFLAGAGTVLVFIAGWLLSRLFGKKNVPAVTGKTPSEVKHEIEKAIADTPACDIVTAADNAEELRANAAGIAEQSKQRLRDRAKSILSGHTGAGADAGGGRGD